MSDHHIFNLIEIATWDLIAQDPILKVFTVVVLLTVFIACFLLPFNLNIGNRQRKEGKGTQKELFRVSAVFVFFQMLPLLLGGGVFLTSDPQFVSNELIVFSSVAMIIVAFWSSFYLSPPVRIKGSDDALNEYTEPLFLSRLEEMCAKLGIRVPVVRLLNSAGGAMGIQAFAGGLPAPSLVVSDGVIHRLSEKEADAIVGHELGHIANNSLWWFPFTISLAWTIAVFGSIWLGFWNSLLFGFAVQAGLSRIVSRHFEYDSDHKAAAVAGFTATITALDKIHISSVVNNKGWLSFLAYSMATHPSHEERLQSLYQRAPLEDRPVVNWSVAAAKRRKIGASIACVVWILLLTGSFLLPQSDLGYFLRSLLFISIGLTPTILINKAIRKDVKSELKRRQFKTKSKPNWVIFSITVIVMLTLFFVLDQVENQALHNSMGEMIWIIFGLPVVVGVILVVWGIWRGSKSPQAKIRLAIHQRRWTDAVESGMESAEKIKSDAPLRHDLNLALWMTGEQEQSIEAMQQLRNDFPDFKHPWLIEALMHLESGGTSRALELIDEVRDDLQGDVSVHGIAARCYRQLGQLEKMESEAAAIQEIMPDAAAVSAFRCAITIDQQELTAAREYWKSADSLAPGDAYITLLKAELELLEGNPTEAFTALEDAKRLINATPFAFLGTELRSIEQQMQESTPASDPNEEQYTEDETENGLG
ncbi:MAG: M48 family metalloprotease [Planctomicrobium sp.]|jgi:Zn-dependent protease with chaperone function/tetratricopeptide (TPR) repeat protein|nr:M48 family metalloprotease [Planctomicrobium sp.]